MATTSQAPVLEVRGLTKRFGLPSQSSHVAVCDVSFAVEKGSRVGIVGGSGCGKSTLAHMAVGLLAPSSGLVRVLGRDIARLDLTAQAKVVRLLQDVCEQDGTALLFICHDLALVQGLCDQVLAMQEGRIVERGPVDEVIRHPRHPYTRSLVRAARA